MFVLNIVTDEGEMTLAKIFSKKKEAVDYAVKNYQKNDDWLEEVKEEMKKDLTEYGSYYSFNCSATYYITECEIN